MDFYRELERQGFVRVKLVKHTSNRDAGTFWWVLRPAANRLIEEGIAVLEGDSSTVEHV